MAHSFALTFLFRQAGSRPERKSSGEPAHLRSRLCAERNPILASNVVMLATFFLSAIAMYLLMRLWVGNRWAAALAGFVYGFAAARVYEMPRVHVINLQLIPLIILFLLRFLSSGRWLNLVMFSVLMFFQLLSSLHAGVFAGFVVLAFLLAHFFAASAFSARRAMAVLASLFIIGIPLLPVAIPYLHWEKQGVLSTETLPAELYSATPYSYLNGDSNLYPDLLKRFQAPFADYEKKLFFGFVPLGFSLLAVVDYLLKASRLRSHKKIENRPADSDARPATI